MTSNASPTRFANAQHRLDEVFKGHPRRDEALREIVAILHEEIALYNWVGIYVVEKDELILHNFLGYFDAPVVPLVVANMTGFSAVSWCGSPFSERSMYGWRSSYVQTGTAR